MNEILIIRHGQSEWNAVGRWQGQANPPLTELGIKQAQTASNSVGVFDLIFASPLQRASHTASIIGESKGVGPVLLDEDLMERDAGPWQGLTRQEIEEGWPGFLESGKRPEGYEKNEELLVRVFSALKRIVDLTNGSSPILVVSHAGIIHALENLKGETSAKVPNLGGRWTNFNKNDLTMGKRVDLISDGTTNELL